jgi:hypothetical protein
MRWTSTLILLAITIGLGAYISLHELKQPDRAEHAALATRVVSVDPDAVTEITVEWPSVTATLKRTGDAWRISSPIAVPADQAFVDQLLGHFADLRADRVLTAPPNKPLDLAEFSLAEPRATVTLTSPGSTTTALFGELTAMSKNQYVTLPGSPKVFVIDDTIARLLDQPIDTYRSRDVWSFEPFQVAQVSVESPVSTYRLEQRDDRWRLVEPIQDLVDSAEASMLISRIRNLRSERLITDAPKPEELPGFGFDAPHVRVTVSLPNGQSQVLLVGHQTKENPAQRYAQAGSEPTVHAVSQERLDQWLRPAQELRSRVSLEFFAGRVEKLQVTWDRRSWTAEKHGDGWSLAEPPTVLDPEKVEQFLWTLNDTKFTRFVEDRPADLARYGLTDPAGVVKIWTAESEQPQELRIGLPTDSGGRYAQTAGRPLVAELPPSIIDVVSAKPESLAIPATPTPAPAAP